MEKTIPELFRDLNLKINDSLEYHELQKKFDKAPTGDTTISKLTFKLLSHDLTDLAKVILDLFFRNNNKYQYISHLFNDNFAQPKGNQLQMKLGNYFTAQINFKNSFKRYTEHNIIIESINQIQHGYEFYDELLSLILANTFKIVDPNYNIDTNKLQFKNKIDIYTKHIKHQYFLDKGYYKNILILFNSNKRNSFSHKNYNLDVSNKIVKYFDRDMNENKISYEDLLKERFNINDNIISYIVTITVIGVITHTKEHSIIPKEYFNFCFDRHNENK